MRIRALRWWIAGMLAIATALSYLDRQSFPIVVSEVRREIPIRHEVEEDGFHSPSFPPKGQCRANLSRHGGSVNVRPRRCD